MRQLMQLIRKACLNARADRVSLIDVERAAAKEKNHFERFIWLINSLSPAPPIQVIGSESSGSGVRIGLE